MVRKLFSAALSAMTLVASSVGAGENTWTTNGPPGSVGVLTIDPVTRHLFAGARVSADHDSLFRSSDHGESWLALADAPTGTSLTEIEVDPTNSTRLYAVANALGAPFSAGNVYRTEDAGSTWVRVGWVNGAIYDLAVRPERPETLFAGGIACYCVQVLCFFHTDCSAGVFRSDDAGANWIRLTIRLGSSSIASIVLDPLDRNRMYAAGDGGVLVSTDGGNNWAPINSGLESCPSVTSLVVRRRDGVLYAGTARSASNRFDCGGVFRSSDGGSTWVATGLEPHYVSTVAIDPSDEQTLYAGAYRIGFFSPPPAVFRSEDGGDSWESLGSIPGAPSVWKIVVEPSGRTIHAATSTGVFDYEIVPGARPPVVPRRTRRTRVLPSRP